jgi:dCMP deaminase
MRPDWDTYFLQIAKEVSSRGTCLRRRYGAVLVDKDHQIVSTGYCGAPSGRKDCLQRQKCWRSEHNIPSGMNYDKCRSVHAEMNALLQAGDRAKGCTLYLYGQDATTGEPVSIKPCSLCAKIIVNRKVEAVVMLSKDGIPVALGPIGILEDRLKELGLDD